MVDLKLDENVRYNGYLAVKIKIFMHSLAIR